METIDLLLIQVVLLAVVTSVHTYLGLHVIRRGIVFSDLALDQLAAFGVIVGIGVGIAGGTTASYLLSFVAVLFGSVLLAFIKPRKSVSHEAIIGIIYCLSLVASILVADKFSGGSAYVTQTLAGTMLWVNWSLVGVTVVTYIVLSLFHYFFRQNFMDITEGKEVRYENLWDLLFFISLGIITVLIVPIAGVLLAYAFLMIPAAIATLFSKNWATALKIGWITGFASSLTGLFLSYTLNLPYGPTLVICLGAFFIIALGIKAAQPH